MTFLNNIGSLYPGLSIQRLVIVSIACGLLYWGFGVFYNVFLSPLRAIPGPARSKISSIDLTLAGVAGQRAHKLLELHKVYGPIVRIGPSEVSIGTFKHYRSIYASPKVATKLGAFYSAATFVGHDNIFQMTNKAQHAARRKLEATPYSEQKMASIEPYVRQKARVLTDRLLSRSALSPSGTTNVFELCGLFSFEVVCKIGFAKDFLEDGDDSAIPLLKAMDGSAMTLIFEGTMPWLKRSGLSTKMPGAIGHAYRCFDYWECRSREMVEHFLNNTSEDDAYLLTPLIRNTDNFLGRQLNNEELVEEAMGAMFAGSGTTSTTLTYLFYAISRPENQSIQERLREEVLSISGDLQSIKQLPYLNAVIKETFRLYPTIISTLPRVLDEPLTIESHVLPPGTIVGMQNYVHQRDPTVFPDPERFVPERWLQSTDAMDEALTPFSLGRRNCIGQNLAWLELWLAVYEVVSKVRLTLGKEMRAEDMDMEDRFNTAPKGRKLMLQVTGV